MEADRRRLQDAYAILSRASERAYRDGHLISNDVLGKSPFATRFLERFVSQRRSPKPSFAMIAGKLIAYYVKSGFHFIAYLLRFLECKLSRVSCAYPAGGEEFILIDTPFLMERITSSAEFHDGYFPGLEEAMRKRGHRYAYAPLFYSSANNKRPFELFSALRSLKRQGVPLLAEHQMLSCSDIVELLLFILTYPFRVLRYLRSFSPDTRGADMVNYEIVDTLDHVTFHSFARYLFGRRLAALPVKCLKLISWYENQPFNKQFYRGLRSRQRGTVTIYGAQLFLYSPGHLNLIPDEREVKFGVVPDTIMKNGPYYVPKNTRLHYRVGPSLRYRDLLALDGTARSAGADILVLLPYYADGIRAILKMVGDADLGAYSLVIKTHPAVPLNVFRRLIPPNARIVDGPVCRLFASTRIVIGAASGAMVEAASAGIPVIVVKSGTSSDFNNPLPLCGKGVIWEEADSAKGLQSLCALFGDMSTERSSEIADVARQYRQMFFCEPTEDRIVNFFDL